MTMILRSSFTQYAAGPAAVNGFSGGLLCATDGASQFAVRERRGSVQHGTVSHGHYDHTGGLSEAWRAPDRTPLYLHAAALAARYRVAASGLKVIGMTHPVRERVTHHPSAVRYISQPAEIAPGLWLTGYVPRPPRAESAEPEPFFLDSSGQQFDPLADDQALDLVTGRRIIVVLGCAHAGVINTLADIGDLTQRAPLRAAIGGMPLRAASAPRLAWTVDQWQRLNPDLLVPAHGTGAPATAALTAGFGERCRASGAGLILDFADEDQTATTDQKVNLTC